MYYHFLISYPVVEENACRWKTDLALLWCINVKSTALSAILCECACKEGVHNLGAQVAFEKLMRMCTW